MGTKVSAKVSRVVDGDTLRVFLPGNNEKDEALRILALDTEESNAGSSKPVTPWGKKAKERAMNFFLPGDTVELEFPGEEDYEICLKRYRGNYGRLLVFVYAENGVDFQEVMINEGFSPYFSKYGYASLKSNHERYVAAEMEAQQKHVGVWDQVTVNGSVMRNYPALLVWWNLRAIIIDEYRSIKADHDNLLNSRLDYERIYQKTENGETITVFTELNSIKRINQNSAVVKIGSQHQPFSLYLPDVYSDTGQRILNLLNYRYLSHGEEKPGRSYAYVTGKLSFYRNKPQMIITKPEQFTDSMIAD